MSFGSLQRVSSKIVVTCLLTSAMIAALSPLSAEAQTRTAKVFRGQEILVALAPHSDGFGTSSSETTESLHFPESAQLATSLDEGAIGVISTGSGSFA